MVSGPTTITSCLRDLYALTDLNRIFEFVKHINCFTQFDTYLQSQAL